MQVCVMEKERLNPKRKLELVQGMMKSNNVKDYAAQMEVDRSYLYELRREMEEASLEAWSQKTVGRPRQPEPDSDIAQLRADLDESKEKAIVWEVRAKAADIILKAVEAAGALKKTSSGRPIFWRE